MSLIPADWRQRAPAMTERAWAGLCRTLQHVDAPRWNQTIGDRIGGAELDELAAFRRLLAERPLEADRAPSAAMAAWVEALRGRLFLLDDLPAGFDFARDFEDLPTTDRESIVTCLEDLVPRDLPLDAAIVYSTSATTGHPVIVPSHPGAMVKNLAHLEELARLHGVALDPHEGEPFALNVSLQRQTYCFATVKSGWSGAVFVKLNLAEHDWAGGAAARGRFLGAFAAPFVASEPVTLAEAIALELPLRPRLVVSSAVRLSPDVARLASSAWGAAVVDLYSTTETGPVAASVPGADGHVVLLPDLFVEALDEGGARVPDGVRGELTVTGGRNPYLPLVRYRTGDFGRLATAALPDGRRARVILDLEGRAPVSFQATDGSPVSSVDIARRIRPLAPFVQHTFRQRAGGAVELVLRPLPGVPMPLLDFEEALRDLFGRDAAVTVRIDPDLGRGGGKVVAWTRER